ncbi:c-type cytochrome [Microseira wollei]|uniref:Cytochrome c, class I n=1 Tax=Microseira wollei NIES-4236 TaxID=2530354 RepID=A0AAV3XCR6_9CYAN|nr:cytochrome c [Microseira wollei]GET40129.1 cytochrome c, class I [Microseira wollei NIES-4236]
MEKQAPTPEVLVWQLIGTSLAVLLIILLANLGVRQWQLQDPYIKHVLSLTGDPIRGHAIFQMNCSGCHGLQADGRVGPSLQGVSKHKSKIGLIHQVTSGETPPMPQFKPNPQDMADLLSYLEEL